MTSQAHYRAGLTLRLLVVAALAWALLAAAGSGRAGSPVGLATNVRVRSSGLSTALAAPLAAGLLHSCAVRRGGVMCWGSGFYGQLGDGTRSTRVTPVEVAGGIKGVRAIDAGDAHSCALTSVGGVRCWGDDQYGELGDGSTGSVRHLRPVGVLGLGSGVVAIAAGDVHTCALIRTGTVKCWGWNYRGQLGDGTTSTRFTPVDVVGVSDVTAIAAGFRHSCAATSTGGAECWGRNLEGQLGDGTTSSRLTPVEVTGLSGVTAIAAGDFHSCALASSGAVKCWGLNRTGELGDGTTIDRLTPVDVSKLSGGVVAITAGAFHSCALTSGGGVKCWGLNDYGQLGDGTTSTRLAPVAVSGLGSHVIAIAAGAFHTCALIRTGIVKCWGDNRAGQLGDGTTSHREKPVRVVGLRENR